MKHIVLITLASLFMFATFQTSAQESFKRPQCVKPEVWNKVLPYFLPSDHPCRSTLDNIFSQNRATLSLKSLKKAGFFDPRPMEWTRVIVTKHPDLPGYVFKIYVDAQRYYKGKPEYEHWIERIHGRDAINIEIQKLGISHLFKVPKKWVYPLPEFPSPPKEMLRKNFILVEEDMDIFDDKTNLKVWKSDWVDEDTLTYLYHLLETLGLHDCAKPANIPFSRDGKIAFVDTQTLYSWPVPHKNFGKYLSDEMQLFWTLLIKSN